MPFVLCFEHTTGLDNGYLSYREGVDSNWVNWATRDVWAPGSPSAYSGWQTNWTSGRTSAVRRINAGEDCGLTSTYAYVIMKGADYQAITTAWTGLSTENVSSLIPAVALVWAVAWLFKRLLAVLRNQI